ncbi:MAG: Alpha-tubulin suppressor and related protein-like protein [Acidimicrobiales bacterium]|nr:Alpha-tubulin suppressor and related protein-like protein [Acidimicrobiales bacterium]
MMQRVSVSRMAIAVVACAVLVLAGLGVAEASEGDSAPANGGTRPSTRQVRAVPPISRAAIFTSIAPCRVLDTRPSTPLVNSERDFKVTGALAAQGGSNTCGIPANATAVAINLTGIATGNAGGYVRGWADDATPPNATLLNFASSINASNQVDIPLCTGCVAGNRFTLRAYGSADVVGDAVGYYTPPMYAIVNTDGNLYSNISSGLISVNRASIGHYNLYFHQDITRCAVVASDLLWATSRDVSPDAVDDSNGHVEIEVRDHSNALTDTIFNVSVTC